MLSLLSQSGSVLRLRSFKHHFHICEIAVLFLCIACLSKCGKQSGTKYRKQVAAIYNISLVIHLPSSGITSGSTDPFIYLTIPLCHYRVFFQNPFF